MLPLYICMRLASILYYGRGLLFNLSPRKRLSC
nr:MAG TPA: hypothetical protein [Caudoviricetes sp.]